MDEHEMFFSLAVGAAGLLVVTPGHRTADRRDRRWSRSSGPHGEVPGGRGRVIGAPHDLALDVPDQQNDEEALRRATEQLGIDGYVCKGDVEQLRRKAAVLAP